MSVTLVVTLVVTGLFLTIFMQTIITIGYQRMVVAREAAANDIAYSNLRKVSSRSMLASLPCEPGGVDLTQSPYNFTVEPDGDDQVKSLGSGHTQTL